VVRALLYLTIVLAGCARGGATGGTSVALRAACGADEHWDGTTCVARGGIDELEAGRRALAAFEVDAAIAALDRAAAAPLDHARHVALWEQRGIAQAYLEREPEALAAFDRLLALDPGHLLSYTLSPKATFVFEKARATAAARGAPALELRWPRDQRLGASVPLEVETIADPDGLLDRATIYVRTRGEPTWRAADLSLADVGALERVRLPAVAGTRPTSLEIYAVASDAAGNEVLSWASPARPREIPLRYEPPTPWYRRWWVWAAAGGVVAVGTGVAVYAAVWEPGPAVGGGVVVVE
jgi:tetratricopeptide (TPR) repeat protein